MTYQMAESGSNGSGADNALRWIGDLDHPFYSDERNRYVWYEASAIAFQLLFISSYFTAGLLLWVGGADSLVWVLPMFLPTLITAGVFQSYLKRHCAEYWPTKNDFLRRRGQLGVFAGVFLITGLIRAVVSLQDGLEGDVGSFAGGTSVGLLTGLIVGPLAAAALITYKSRKAVEDEES